MHIVPKVGWFNGHGAEISFEVRTVYELLDGLRRKPGLFIGQASLTALDSFLHGFRTALDSIGNPLEDEEPPFRAFDDWIAARFGYSESTSGWKNMLLKSSGGDESIALKRFFTELDEFRRTKPS